MLEIGIPIWNAKDTLPALLDSLVTQTKKNFIVTLCCDGDNEDYSEIINIYIDRGLKIKYLYCQENKGPGLTRQYILDNSISDYITFIDADDMVTPRFVEVLYSQAKLGDYDIIRGGVIRENANGADSIIEASSSVITWMHAKIYRVSFLREKDIRFIDDLRSDEDAYFNQVAINATSKIGIINEQLYIWRANPNSITRIEGPDGYFKKSYLYYIRGQIEAIKKIYQLNGEVRREIITSVMKQIYYHYMTARYYKIDETDMIKIISQLKELDWIQDWLNDGQNWIDIVSTIRSGNIYNGTDVVFFKETFDLWAKRLLKRENNE